jgi:hypothetical protein
MTHAVVLPDPTGPAMILPNDSLFIKEEQVGGALYDKLLIFHQVCDCFQDALYGIAQGHLGYKVRSAMKSTRFPGRSLS